MPPPPDPRLSRGVLLQLVLSGLALLLFAAATMTTALPAGIRGPVADLLQAAAALGCGAAMSRQSRLADPTLRRAWGNGAAASLAWGAGQLWLGLERVVTGDVVRPGVSDLGFLLAVLFAVRGAVAFPTVAGSLVGRGRALLDGAVVAGSALALTWVLVLQSPGGSASALDDLGLRLAYPLLDCVIATVLVSAVVRLPRQQALPLTLALMGLLLIITTNLVTYALARAGTLRVPEPAEIGFLLGFALAGLGALVQGRDRPTTKPARRVLQQLVPYLGVLPVLVVYGAYRERVTAGPWALLLVLVGMLLLRQLLVLAENADLDDRLLARGRRYEALVEGSADLTFVIDGQGVVVDTSPSVDRLLGPVRGRRFLELVEADDVLPVTDVLAQCTGLRDGTTGQFRLRTATGSVPVDARMTDLRDRPEVGGIVVNARDVTDRWQVQQALADSEHRYRRMAESAAEGLVVSDAEGVVRFANRHFTDLVGLELPDLVGRRESELLAPLLDDESGAELAGQNAQRRQGVSSTYELRVRRSGGEQVHLRISATPLYDSAGRHDGSMALITDTTERVHLERRLQQEAVTDALTGLGNRRRLLEADEELSGPVALIYVDLDQFKRVNDSWGHAAGDELLRETARRLLRCVREQDLVVRVGGDEFAVVLLGEADVGVALAAAERMLQELRRPVVLEGQEVWPGASLGLALSPGAPSGLAAARGSTVAALMRNADTAMYQAKTEGRGRVRAYDPEVRASTTTRMQLEQDLHHALDSGALEVHYQPVIELAGGRCTGVEALVRWRHPERGLLSPDTFISVAEDSGLIVRLGELVLRRALTDAAAWERELGRVLTVSVNVAPRQLSDSELPGLVRRVLGQTGVPAGRLVLEITERSLLAGDVAREQLEALHRLGVGLALDDFGTGWSSLSHLRVHPVDVIKLDRSYVSTMHTDDKAGHLVLGLLGLARHLELSVTAEGIETADQAEDLRDSGCQHGQGFLWSPALSEPDLRDYLVAELVLPAPREAGSPIGVAAGAPRRGRPARRPGPGVSPARSAPRQG